MNRTKLLVGGALLALGCTQQIETVVIDQLSTPPLATIVEDDRFELYDGTAVAFRLQAFTEPPDDPQSSGDCVESCAIYENAEEPNEVRVVGEGSVEVWPIEDEPNQFILVATGEGEGVVVVTAEDAEGSYEVPVTVLPQPDE